MSRADFDPSVIAAHAGGLRALALAILRDRDAAEEVVQETWARALVAPAPSGEGLGGWLRAVARGLAINRLRDDGRRRARESRAARERGRAASDEDERRAETLRIVVDAVLALDEPYRRVVLLRYFDGYEPSAIAARLGVPVATVATRLKRAKERLRERIEPKLEHGAGGFAGALAVIAGIDPRSVGDVVGAGVVLQHGKKLALAALLFVVAGVAWWVMRASSTGVEGLEPDGLAELRGERGRAELVDPRGADQGGASSVRGAGLARRDEGARSSLASTRRGAGAMRATSEREREPVERGPYLHHLVVETLDRDLHPLPGATVLCAPSRGTLNELGTTDWSGRLAVEWRAFEPTCELELLARSQQGATSPLVRVVVAHDVTCEARLALEPPPAAERTPREREPGSSKRSKRDLDEEEPPLREPHVEAIAAPTFSFDLQGNGVFAEPMMLLELRSGPPRASDRAGLVPRPPAPVYESIRLGSGKEEVTRLRRARRRTKAADFDLAIVDELGAPVADVAVSVAGSNSRILTRTDARGRASFPIHWRGKAQLTFGSAPWRVVKESLVIEDEPKQLSRTVYRTEVMPLLLTTSAGEALGDWVVEAWSTRSAAEVVAHARTDTTGRATLAVPQGGPWKLLTRRASADGEIAELLHEAAWPSSVVERHALRDADLGSGGMRVSFAAATGERLAKSEARLWDPRSGQGLVVGGPATTIGGSLELEQRFESSALRSGIYILEGGGLGQRWSSFGEVRVSPGLILDLGRVPFSDHALLEVDSSVVPAETKVTLEFHSLRGGALVRGPSLDVQIPVKFSVSRGTYFVTARYSVPAVSGEAPGTIRDAESVVEQFELRIEPGNPGRVDLGADHASQEREDSTSSTGEPSPRPR